MSMDEAVRLMKQIDEVEDLTVLLDAREAARRVYGALQDFHHATGNPLYLDYMRIVAKAGETLNTDIRAWASKQAMLHAAPADDDGANGG